MKFRLNAWSFAISLAPILLAWGAVSATAQDSRCADCHYANPQADPDPGHLLDWERSDHGREDVGCESCHGGNAATTESFLAHQGLLSSRNPASPVHGSNLPETCGKCHIGPFVAFQKSRHFALLKEGSTEAPTCSTCHGDVAAELLSARRLEQRCSTCHGEGGNRPLDGAALEARVLLQEVGNVRAMLQTASEIIEQVEDGARRQELELRLEQAEVPLIEAVRAGHAFVFDPERERLRTARERVEILLLQLANPPE